MANGNEDERRRRRGIQLTPMQEDWLIKAMAAERAGQAMPPLPTQRVGVRSPSDADYVTPIGGQQPAANQGREALAPAYVDPRSQAIAQTPGLVRPAHSMLDKLFRPGRADAANQMNREYLENALKNQMARSGQRAEQRYNQARGSSLEADAAIKELQRRAMSGDDPEALKSLKEYYKAESLRRGGSGPNDIYQRILEGRDGGDEPIDPVTGRIPTRRPDGAGAGGSDPLTRVVDDSMTPTEAGQAVSSEMDAIDQAIQQIKDDQARGKHEETQPTQAPYGGYSPPTTRTVENTVGWNKQAEARLTKLQADRDVLEKSEYAPRGSATVANPDI